MNVRGRRDFRGVFRETPEEILRRAIAAHKALRDREQWEVAKAAQPTAERKPAKRKANDAEIRQAQFAEALARSEFGRFYYKNGKGKK